MRYYSFQEADHLNGWRSKVTPRSKQVAATENDYPDPIKINLGSGRKEKSERGKTVVATSIFLFLQIRRVVRTN